MSETSGGKSSPLDTLTLHLMAILGAAGLLAIVKDLLTWQNDLGNALDTFRGFSRPVVSLPLGKAAELLQLSVPAWVIDYAVAAFISVVAFLRSVISVAIGGDGENEYGVMQVVVLAVFSFLLWPVWVLFATWSALFNRNDVFVRSWIAMYVYGILIVAINYAVVLGLIPLGG